MSSEAYFQDFLGNKALIARLCQGIDTGSLPHALLFVGEDGCGRAALARLAAAAYLGDKKGLVARGVHPDCITLLGTGALSNITVEAVREASFEMSKSAVMTDEKRAVIVKDCRSLNASSFAALLKILENPPAGVKFFLTASGQGDVAETVRSRCATFLVSPLSVSECAAALQNEFPKADAKQADMLSAFFRGRLGLARAALADKNSLGLVQISQALADAAVRGDKLTALSLLDRISERAAFSELMRDLSFAFFSLASESRLFDDRAAKCSVLASKASERVSHSGNIKLCATQLAVGLCSK